MPPSDDSRDQPSTPERPDLGDPTEITETIRAIDPRQAIRDAETAAGIPGFEGFALVVTGGPRQGSHWLIEHGEWEAGRNIDAFIFLDDVTVSRHHARFVLSEGRLEVQDLGSTNGTYVNGARTDYSSLVSGDEVIIGRFHLVVARSA
ncbi:MAG: FHA domain-containing protein [Acidimicrobiia bacterium]|nr:FHA domain-containing protein [Acidimicrobiia bacterium]